MTEPNLRWDSSDFEDADEEMWAHEALTENLTTFMKKVHPDGDWRAKVENFGWQRLNGYKDFEAKNGLRLLQKVLPETECTYSIWLDEKAKKITINNAHHDVPCGGELYTITPQSKSED